MATNKKTGKKHEPVELTDSAARKKRTHDAEVKYMGKPNAGKKVRQDMDSHKSKRQSALEAAQRATGGNPRRQRKS